MVSWNPFSITRKRPGKTHHLLHPSSLQGVNQLLLVAWKMDHTILHRLDEERDNDVVRRRYSMDLEVLCQVTSAINERLRDVALVVVMAAVGQ